ncbi:transcriptional repressor [candidate division KSB1 bacterium]|nr:transcriptional repressor [candidate division KSB1 bacterium]
MSREITFGNYLQDKGLKGTQQRDEVADLFLKADRHFSVEELYRRVQKSDPRIGFSTVYRTLKLLVEAGLATERQFGDGFTRFEPVHREEHHDHLICIKCGKIVEFKDDRIEELQNGVAGKHNFRVTDHKLELYGYCNRCE